MGVVPALEIIRELDEEIRQKETLAESSLKMGKLSLMHAGWWAGVVSAYTGGAIELLKMAETIPLPVEASTISGAGLAAAVLAARSKNFPLISCAKQWHENKAAIKATKAKQAQIWQVHSAHLNPLSGVQEAEVAQFVAQLDNPHIPELE